MSTLALTALLVASLAANVAAAFHLRRRRARDAGAAARDARLHESQELLLALQRQERQFRSVIEAAGSVIVGLRPDFSIFEWNAEAAALLGVPREEAMGEDYLARFVPESVRPAVAEDLARVLAGATTRGFENAVVDTSGRQRVLLWNVTRMDGDDGPAGIIAMGQDITERKRAERALQDARDYMEAVIQSSADGIVTFDRTLRFTGWSRAMEAHTGKPASEVLGRVATELFPSLLENARGEAHRAALRGETLHMVDLPFTMRATGRQGWTDESYAPIHGRDGRVLGGIALVRDVTERKRAQLQVEEARRAAEEASRAKSDFLARMSHELRTPLTAIIGFSSYLLRVQQEDPAANPAQRDYLGRIAANGRHLLGLINDILDLSKIEAGRADVTLAPAALDAMVREVVQLLEGEARDGVALVADVPPSACPLVTDAGKLRQVLVNLVGNALKFTHAGQVTVRLECDAGGRPVALAVSDTGIGIPPERRAAVFEAFEQADTSTTRQYGGTGLGLSISLALCRMLGATLSLESEVGRGTTFRVALAAPAGA